MNSVNKKTLSGKKRLFWGLTVLLFGGVLIFLILQGLIHLSFPRLYKISLKEVTSKTHSYSTKQPLISLFKGTQGPPVKYDTPKMKLSIKNKKGGMALGQFQFSFLVKDPKIVEKMEKKPSELIETLQKVFDQVYWEDIKGPQGKTKVKKMIQDQMNQDWNEKVITGVYYRFIILR